MLIEPFILAVAAAMTASVAYCASLFAARSRRFLDHPNERSSHVSATPRTGGLAIIGAWCAGLFVLAAFSESGELAATLSLLGMMSLAAMGLGLADDRFDLMPLWKFVGQIIVAALFAALFGPFESFPLPYFGEATLPPVAGVGFTILWIVGFMNVFNFMDGANGIAAGAAAVGLAWICVTASYAGAPVLAVASLLLALAAAGFLPENLNRGKIFMGDNGSQALGFLIAAFAVLGVNWSGARMNALIVPVIFMPFLFDVGWTLISRLIRKQNIVDPHREHLYQLLLRSGASHASVAMFYMGLISLCAAAAILMLTLPSSLQSLAPVTLIIIFSIGAVSIYRRADQLNLLQKPPHSSSGQAMPATE